MASVGRNNINENDDNANNANNNAIYDSRNRQCTSPLPSTGIYEVSYATHVERLKRAKEIAKLAAQAGMICQVVGNGGPFVRESLKSRGWVEKIDTPVFWEDARRQVDACVEVASFYKTQRRRKHSLSRDPASGIHLGADFVSHESFYQHQLSLIRRLYRSELSGIANALRPIVPGFFWTSGRTESMFTLLNSRPDIFWNHYGSSGGSFCTKGGLCDIMNEIHWTLDLDQRDIFPRAFQLSRPEDVLDFVVDFKVTACLNLLKLVAEMQTSEDDEGKEYGLSEDLRKSEEVMQTGNEDGGGERKKEREEREERRKEGGGEMEKERKDGEERRKEEGGEMEKEREERRKEEEGEMERERNEGEERRKEEEGEMEEREEREERRKEGGGKEVGLTTEEEELGQEDFLMEFEPADQGEEEEEERKEYNDGEADALAVDTNVVESQSEADVAGDVGGANVFFDANDNNSNNKSIVRFPIKLHSREPHTAANGLAVILASRHQQQEKQISRLFSHSKKCPIISQKCPIISQKSQRISRKSGGISRMKSPERQVEAKRENGRGKEIKKKKIEEKKREVRSVTVETKRTAAPLRDSSDGNSGDLNDVHSANIFKVAEITKVGDKDSSKQQQQQQYQQELQQQEDETNRIFSEARVSQEESFSRQDSVKEDNPSKSAIFENYTDIKETFDSESNKAGLTSCEPKSNDLKRPDAKRLKTRDFDLNYVSHLAEKLGSDFTSMSVLDEQDDHTYNLPACEPRRGLSSLKNSQAVPESQNVSNESQIVFDAKPKKNGITKAAFNYTDTFITKIHNEDLFRFTNPNSHDFLFECHHKSGGNNRLVRSHLDFSSVPAEFKTIAMQDPRCFLQNLIDDVIAEGREKEETSNRSAQSFMSHPNQYFPSEQTQNISLQLNKNLSPQLNQNETIDQLMIKRRKMTRASFGTPYPGHLSQRIVELALIQLEAVLSHCNHEDIDNDPTMTDVTCAIADHAWPRMLRYIEEITSGTRTLDLPSQMIIKSRTMMQELIPLMKQHHIDGDKNMWIIKPPNSCQGRGIIISKNLAEILRIAKSRPVICQKYIERPLTILDTKFDIRQWFLITSWNPLMLWWYNDCYIRFSSQIFDLQNFKISIHLTNNAVQKHFKNQRQRSALLPEENMWDSETFADYCQAQTFGIDVFRTVTIPKMKTQITGVMKCATDFMIHRHNSFELYGADFMLDEEYHPWLLEINACPALSGSTSVTKRLCRSVIEDTMKVVLDKRLDDKAETGGFELLYEERGPSKENLNKEIRCSTLLKVNGMAFHIAAAKNQQKSPPMKTRESSRRRTN